jgi:hypothetical protein
MADCNETTTGPVSGEAEEKSGDEYIPATEGAHIPGHTIGPASGKL